MMKRLILTAAMTAIIASGVSALDFDSFSLSGPLTVRRPVLFDSINTRGEKFDVSGMLSANIRTDRKKASEITPVDGKLTLPKGEGDRLYLLQTDMRAARFAKGKLKVTSPSRFELNVDGVSKLKKVTSEDSISPASTMETAIELLPEKNSRIEIRVLALADDKMEPSVSLEFTPDAGYEEITVAQGPELTERFNLMTTICGPRVSGVSISPDGKYYITRYNENFTPQTKRTWATLSECATGKVINPRLNESVAWMPTGSTLYFTEAADKGFNLFTMNPVTAKIDLIAENIPDQGIIWSPTEDYFIYYSREEGKKEEGVMRRYTSPDDRMPGNRDKYQLKMYQPATGQETTLTYGANSSMLSDISADGRKLLITVMRETPDKYPFYASTLLQMDANTLEVDTLVTAEGESSIGNAIYSPDASQVFLTAGPSFSGGIGFNAGNHEIANDFDIQGYLLDIKSGAVKAMTKDFNPSIDGSPVWNRADGRIYFQALEGFDNTLYALDPKSGSIKKLPSEVRCANSFSIGDNESRWLAYAGQGFDYAGRAYMLDLKNNTSRLIDDPMAEYLSDVKMGDVQPWSFVNSRGDTIDGIICTPPDFDNTKKYPLIVYYYGGTAPTDATMTHPYAAQLFASRDYVVYMLNPSGTPGYGQEFSARHVNAWGKYTADDIIEGTKEFCTAHPFVDSKKIGCLGASYGGFMTQYLLTRTDIFAAAISHAGISNVTSYWGEGYWGYSYNSVAAAKSYPWNNPKLFTEQGSLFNADKIHTPLLLLHGTVDTNVPIGESIQLFNALRILGRDVEFISVDGQNHFISDFPHRQLWQNTIMAWFAKWLQDDPQWWNSLYGN